ncbi:MAG TPA: universal stress protein [Pirellulales bacterium]|nr:universal stress protein [Pirellulales bacterium]
MPKTILHPTDFSDCSNCALQIAADLATKYGSQIFVLHVVETLGPANVTFGEVGNQLEPEGYRDRLWAELRKMKPLGPPESSIDYLLVEGDPARGIEQVAEQRHCDLIVMGTHGHRGLERFFMGSVAEHVVRKAACAVVTVKLPRAAVS